MIPGDPVLTRSAIFGDSLRWKPVNPPFDRKLCAGGGWFPHPVEKPESRSEKPDESDVPVGLYIVDGPERIIVAFWKSEKKHFLSILKAA